MNNGGNTVYWIDKDSDIMHKNIVQNISNNNQSNSISPQMLQSLSNNMDVYYISKNDGTETMSEDEIFSHLMEKRVKKREQQSS